MRWGKEIGYFSNFSPKFEKGVKGVRYRVILAKFVIFWIFIDAPLQALGALGRRVFKKMLGEFKSIMFGLHPP